MIEPVALVELEARALRRALRAAFPRLGLADDWALEDVFGAEAPIDLVGRDPGGRVALLLVARPGDELAAIGLALAQRAWVESRLPDWRQLAPERGLRPELGVRVLVVGADFGGPARAASGAGIELWRATAARSGGRLELLLERVEGASDARTTFPASRTAPSASRFRPGGSDAELGLTPAERREFD